MGENKRLQEIKMRKMNKVLRLLKVGFIAFSLAIVFGMVSMPQRTDAQTKGGCATTTCMAGAIYGCYACNNSACTGCYRANNESGCGVCSGGPKESDEVEVDTSWFSF